MTLNATTAPDPYSLPLYSQREAAHIIGASPSTVRSWVMTVARRARASDPVIRLPDGSDGRLSFHNVVEAYVLNQIRRHARVPMPDVRRAVSFAERELGVERLLVRRELRWEAGGHLFWAELSQLANLSLSGQIVMREIVDASLHRMEWDEATGLPRRFFPPIETDTAARSVVVDPRVGFGQPTLAGTGVGTTLIARRIDAGEDIADIARDYEVDEQALKQALVYERPG